MTNRQQKFIVQFLILTVFAILLFSKLTKAVDLKPQFLPNSNIEKTFWIKVLAKNKMERSKIADLGMAIDVIEDDYVVVIGKEKDAEKIKDAGFKTLSFEIDARSFDFPQEDSQFHNLDRLNKAIDELKAKYPQILRTTVIGKSFEKRDIVALEISTDAQTASNKPGIVFMGTHHAREHLSTEIPLMLAQYLCEKFAAGDAEVTRLVKSRQIFIMPVINPDGANFDVASGQYQMWRKNRRPNGDGTYGVDLNRNYDQLWGQGGSSSDTDSDVYMGTAPFSEPETQAVRDFLTNHHNINILLSYHTFSKLVLYPWGGSNDPIGDTKDHDTFKKMATTMAQWNGYKPEQSSDLYIATGDTCDWAYAKLKIFAFTFEMDPSSLFQGGFYPGQSMIQPVFDKNLKPALYLIDLADNPYRVLNPAMDYGLNSPLL